MASAVAATVPASNQSYHSYIILTRRFASLLGYLLRSVDDFKRLLPGLDTGFLDPSDFRKFYKFVFQFSREGTNKTIEKDMVVALLQLVLAGRNIVHLNSFCEFLESSGDENNRISLDSWSSFLDFSMQTSESCEEYDMDEGAWPVLIDEYGEWVQKKSKKK